jgi:hypothetical protein
MEQHVIKDFRVRQARPKVVSKTLNELPINDRDYRASDPRGGVYGAAELVPLRLRGWLNGAQSVRLNGDAAPHTARVERRDVLEQHARQYCNPEPGNDPRHMYKRRWESVRPVEWAVKLCREFGRKVATAEEARRIMKVGVWYNTGEETLFSLGLPPNRPEGYRGFLTYNTDGCPGQQTHGRIPPASFNQAYFRHDGHLLNSHRSKEPIDERWTPAKAGDAPRVPGCRSMGPVWAQLQT